MLDKKKKYFNNEYQYRNVQNIQLSNTFTNQIQFVF